MAIPSVLVNAHLFAGAASDTQTVYRVRGILSENFRCGACKPNWERLLYESLNLLPQLNQRSNSPFSREPPDEPCCSFTARTRVNLPGRLR